MARRVWGLSLVALMLGSAAAATQTPPLMIFFEPGSFRLTSQAKTTLDQVGTAEPVNSIVYIAGNADRTGSRTHNLRLSCQRARAVRDYLTSRGFARQLLVAKGYGEDRPIIHTEDGFAEAKNRNVQIFATPEPAVYFRHDPGGPVEVDFHSEASCR